ncbi:MAG: hypothetical protein ACKPA8_06855, partial [Dolichospermum sp.]
MIAKTDRNNRRTEFKYDDINRLNQEKWVGTDQVINYSYDKASNQTAVNDKFSSLAFNYDNRDRLLSVNNAGTPGFSNVVLNYSYDKVGNVLSVVDTINNIAGGNNSYTYDALNRLTKLTQSVNNVSEKRVVNPLQELGLKNFRVPSDVRSLLFGTDIASMYVQPHVGGDLALLTGIAKQVLELQSQDTSFIERHTEGFAEFA